MGAEMQGRFVGVGATPWRENWDAMREVPCDAERLRLALIWARFTVHARVQESERSFQHWALTGIVGGLWAGQRAKGIASIDTFMATLDYDAFARLSTVDKLDAVVSNVWGLGYVKATFALTTCGLIDLACIDIWALRKRGGRIGRKREHFFAWRSAGAYVKACYAMFGRKAGNGYRQWADYERWHKGFAATQHEPVFNILLGRAVES